MEANVKVKKVENPVDEFADPIKVAREQKQRQELIADAKLKMEQGLEELGAKRRENSWRLPDRVSVAYLDEEGISAVVSVDTEDGLIEAVVPSAEAPAAVERMRNLARADGGKVLYGDKQLDLSLAAKVELFNLVGGGPSTIELRFDDPIEVKNGATIVLPYGV